MLLTSSAARRVIGSRWSNWELFQFIFVSARSSLARTVGVCSGSCRRNSIVLDEPLGVRAREMGLAVKF